MASVTDSRGLPERFRSFSTKYCIRSRSVSHVTSAPVKFPNTPADSRTIMRTALVDPPAQSPIFVAPPRGRYPAHQVRAFDDTGAQISIIREDEIPYGAQRQENNKRNRGLVLRACLPAVPGLLGRPFGPPACPQYRRPCFPRLPAARLPQVTRAACRPFGPARLPASNRGGFGRRSGPPSLPASYQACLGRPFGPPVLPKPVSGPASADLPDPPAAPQYQGLRRQTSGRPPACPQYQACLADLSARPPARSTRPASADLPAAPCPSPAWLADLGPPACPLAWLSAFSRRPARDRPAWQVSPPASRSGLLRQTFRPASPQYQPAWRPFGPPPAPVPACFGRPSARPPARYQPAWHLSARPPARSTGPASADLPARPPPAYQACLV
ncbi:uncharacterized protein LOC135221367 [Macrobrachium nipponense]|uniref:uncharacterized protein LOC135221367 n=1 Tax=Macrobrachium nipponense TaxID=159736 RepID=UPI0030C86A2B